MWLARHLAEFSSLQPETPLHAVVVKDEPDFARSGVDLAIVHVPAHRLRDDDDVLMRETVFPVCSPELYPRASGHVCRSRLLQEMHEDNPEIDWRNWAVHFGLPDDFETKIVRYGSFRQMIGAALGGADITLGRVPLTEPELRGGRLVPLVPGLARDASWRFVLRRNPSARHRLPDPSIAFLRREADAPPFQLAKIVAPASNDSHARCAGSA